MYSKIKELINIDSLKANKKLFIYLFFVCMSTIFWFLNALSKEYTTNVVFPVRYVDFPKGKILTNKLPAHLTLRVKSYGFELIRYKFMSLMPITLGVNVLSNSIIEQQNLNKYSLLTSKIKNRISNKIGTPLSLLDIKPEVINFEFSNIISRKYPIKINLKYTLEKQFQLKNKIHISPDSVMVLGAKNILDSLQCVETEFLDIENIDFSIVEKANLKSIDNVDLDIKKVNIYVDVEKYTEASKNIPLKVENVPDSIILRLFPAYVKVSYLVGLSKYGAVSINDFEAKLDYNSILKGVSTLKVDINCDNTDLTNISVSPKNVSFLKEKL